MEIHPYNYSHTLTSRTRCKESELGVFLFDPFQRCTMPVVYKANLSINVQLPYNADFSMQALFKAPNNADPMHIRKDPSKCPAWSSTRVF